MERSNVLYSAAAATTAAAGIMHLMMSPNAFGFNLNTGILFLVGGLAQIFWVVPMIKKWGTPWYFAGIVGTAVLIGIWAITRMPENMINGRAGAINSNGIIVETLQAAFIILQIIIFLYEKRKSKNNRNVADTKLIQ